MKLAEGTRSRPGAARRIAHRGGRGRRRLRVLPCAGPGGSYPRMTPCHRPARRGRGLADSCPARANTARGFTFAGMGRSFWRMIVGAMIVGGSSRQDHTGAEPSGQGLALGVIGKTRLRLSGLSPSAIRRSAAGAGQVRGSVGSLVKLVDTPDAPGVERGGGTDPGTPGGRGARAKSGIMPPPRRTPALS